MGARPDATPPDALERELAIITQRVREHEEQYRRLVEMANEGVIVIDRDDRITLANGAMEQMLAVPAGGLVGRSMSEFLLPQDAQDFARRKELRVGGVAERFERKLRRVTGEVGTFLVSATPLKDAEGRFAGSFGMISDITTHQQAEDALAEREARYRAVIETSADGFWVVDLEGRILEVNDAYLKRSGYSREELLSMSIKDIDAVEKPEETRARVEQIHREGSGRFEAWHRAKDGTRWAVEISSTWWPFEGGRFFAFVRDVGRRKRVEQLLETRLALSDLAQRGTLDELLVRGLSFAKSLTGSTVSFLHPVGRGTPGDFDHPDAAVLCAESIRTGQPVFANFEAHRAPPLERLLTLPVLRDGKVVAVIGLGGRASDYGKDDLETLEALASLMMDMVARMRAELALRASEERYRTLVENLDDAVYSTDAEGRLTWVSGAVMKLGFEPEALVGRRLRDVIQADDRARLQASFEATLAGEIQPIEVRALDATGAVRHLRISSRPVLERGRAVGVAGVLADLTHQRQTEAQLVLAQKMEAIGRLAGGIAHDFNNLLSVILSFSGFALEGLRDGDPLKEDLEEVRRAGERAAVLTRQLLAFSRRQVLQPEVVNLNTIVSSLEHMLRRLIGEDVELITALAPGLDNARVDRGQVEQVIMNLVVNSRDAMPRGGTLTIATRNVAQTSDATLPPRYVALSVTDTGSGMDAATLARIFEPFFTTKPAGKGTGLGLATVYGIVAQSGGTIRVASSPDHGATFTVCLPPVGEAVPEESAAPAAVTRAKAGETVLVVEDEEAVRSLARRILTAAGYRVLTAANGGEALLTCERHQGELHLVLTDVVMPQMNGRELAARLLDVRPGLRVVFMSGYTDDAVLRDLVETERHGFISKPFDAAALTRAVRVALDVTRSPPGEPDHEV